MMYSDVFSQLDFEYIKHTIYSSTENDVRRALAKENIRFQDFLVLLSPAAEGFLSIMAGRAKSLTDKHFGKVIHLYAPLYLSNECESGCIYCGFNTHKKIERKTLSPEEAYRELKALKEKGYQSVLLLTGENPIKADLSYLVEHITQARDLFPYVALEIYPASEEIYAGLAQAGALGLTVYQETYHRDTYQRVHPSGEKRDFIRRLDTPDRALTAGFRRAGIGALLGLYDSRLEAAVLGNHAGYLMKKYWRSEINISFPRLRNAGAGYQPEYPVNDRALVQMIFALRCYLPQAGITLSTRESADLRDNLIGYGVTMMSAGSRTNPGGYSGSEDAGEQFSVEDTRSVEQVISSIRQKGYFPVFKDWDSAFQPLGK